MMCNCKKYTKRMSVAMIWIQACHAVISGLWLYLIKGEIGGEMVQACQDFDTARRKFWELAE